MPLSQFEHQLYGLLIEIKQTSATISTDVACLKEALGNIKSELDEVTTMALNNRHDIVQLKSGMKAWITAAAAIGGIVGWILSVVKEVLMK